MYSLIITELRTTTTTTIIDDDDDDDDDDNNNNNLITTAITVTVTTVSHHRLRRQQLRYDLGDHPYRFGPAASESLAAAKCIPLWLQNYSATRPLLCQSGAPGWAGLTLVSLPPRRSFITPTLPEALTTGPGSGLGQFCGQTPL
ncbi:RNA binding effector protein Scp160 [Aspergillus tubingensis]|uniref:RNA binding effector protein Scp160 n=1 Tax=Aspergillus tubingensis TaxID=5068 RepID=UPI001579E800|nr:RNA binding effector protein Scp160 [Aspergillus tubingensis]GFN19043.1 RNA binding effector protein Scp160 [Aspergillus tubingensis]